jgi:nicotinamide-nucleotide amidase
VIDQLVARLAALGQTMATAESLTGGLVAATVVDVPGSSKVLRGGLIVYATDLKHALAGVDSGLLASQGPVSPAVAASLARGARSRCGADWGVSTTGVAGPDPQDGVPVGTVFVAVSGPGVEEVRELHLAGDRPTIRAAAVQAALSLLWENL